MVKLAAEREEPWLSRRKKPDRQEPASLLLSEQSAIHSVVTLCQSGRVVRSNRKGTCSFEAFSGGVRLGNNG